MRDAAEIEKALAEVGTASGPAIGWVLRKAAKVKHLRPDRRKAILAVRDKH